MYGIWVTFSVRNVHLQLFNETKYVGFSLYLVVVAFIVLLPIHLANVGNRATVFIVRSAVLMITIMGTVFLVFVPKFIVIFKGGDLERNMTSRSASSSTFDSKVFHLQKDLETLNKENKELRQKLHKYEKESSVISATPSMDFIGTYHEDSQSSDSEDHSSTEDTISLAPIRAKNSVPDVISEATEPSSCDDASNVK